MSTTLWLLLWLLAPQQPLALEGIVVRAGTTQPLAGEVVGLWPTTRTVKADAEGRFRFGNIEPGSYALTVVHDGIKVQVPVTVTRTQRIETYTVEVRSAPAIVGTVFDPNGERVAGAHIQAFRTVYTPLGRRIQSVMSVLTDDLGEFRLFRLRSGEYYVTAGLSDREQRTGAQGLRLTPNLSRPDDGFPPIFFGGGFNPSESQIVRLGRESDATGVQIFLRDVPRYTISGQLIPEGICARVALAQEGGLLKTDADSAPKVCGSFRFSGLSRGTYSLLATNDQFASEVIRVSTTNPVTEIKIPLAPTVDIFGRVSGVTTTALAGTNVRLSRSSSDVSQDIEAPLAADGSFAIPGVGPGSFDVSLQPLPDKTFVRTITYAARDALLSPMVVGTSVAGRLDIQIAQSALFAEGVVVDRGGSPVADAEVVLVPRDFLSRRRADRYLTTRADAGGNFRINGIPSVDYAVLAFEQIDGQAYFALAYDLALFSRYTVNAPGLRTGGSNNPLRLVAIPASETVGGFR
jgi:hypothetical protein